MRLLSRACFSAETCARLWQWGTLAGSCCWRLPARICRCLTYTPQQVKDAVVGYGRATKSQVQEMVRVLMGMESIPRPDDAADAIAIAICHLYSARLTFAVKWIGHSTILSRVYG